MACMFSPYVDSIERSITPMISGKMQCTACLVGWYKTRAQLSLDKVDRTLPVANPNPNSRHLPVATFSNLSTYLISRSYYFRYQQISKKLFLHTLCIANCGLIAANIATCNTTDSPQELTNARSNGIIADPLRPTV